MQKRFNLFLESILSLMGRSKVLTIIARKVLLSHYVREGLERTYRFYVAARFEKEHDTWKKSYHLRPRLDSPQDHITNVEVSKKNLCDIKRILDQKGLRHWLIFGTFLGAYRNKAIIPYDNDTDLAIYSEDLPTLVGCEDAFTKEGFYLGVEPGIATLYRDGENTDFYLFQLDGDKRVWVSVRYDISAFETYNEIQFLGQNFRILSDPEKWLRYTYGEDWKTPIKGKGCSEGYPYGVQSE